MDILSTGCLALCLSRKRKSEYYYRFFLCKKKGYVRTYVLTLPMDMELVVVLLFSGTTVLRMSSLVTTPYYFLHREVCQKSRGRSGHTLPVCYLCLCPVHVVQISPCSRENRNVLYKFSVNSFKLIAFQIGPFSSFATHILLVYSMFFF